MTFDQLYLRWYFSTANSFSLPICRFYRYCFSIFCFTNFITILVHNYKEQSCLFSLFFLPIIPKINSSSLLMSRSVCSPCFLLFCRHQIYPPKNFIVNESAPLILLVLQLWLVLLIPLVLFSPRFYPQYKMNPSFNLGLAGLIAVFQNIFFIPKDKFLVQP